MINCLLIICVVLGFLISVYSGILIIFMVIGFKVYQKKEIQKQKESIEEIIQQINDILYHKRQMYIQNYNEGTLSLLENEISKLVLRLSEQNNLLQKERSLLKESLEDVSHQIKTPLTSLNLIVERLKDTQLTDKERYVLLKEEVKLLDKIEWLIRSLLKLAQIDANSITFTKEKVNIKEFIKKVIEPFEIAIDVKDIDVIYTYNQESCLYIDEQWSIEALSNIVKNCIEHLHVGGQLSINITHSPIYDEIIISDNGKGIDNDDLPHLFERFYKGKASNSDSVGIGLALTKKIIDCQDGTITVENTYPGAKFTIHFYKEVV